MMIWRATHGLLPVARIGLIVLRQTAGRVILRNTRLSVLSVLSVLSAE